MTKRKIEAYEGSGNVFADLGLPNPEERLLKSSIVTELHRLIKARPCTAEGAQCRVGDTRSLGPRAYGTNRSNSNTSCSSRLPPSCAAASARSAPGRPRSWMPIDGLPEPADRECRVALVRGQSSG